MNRIAILPLFFALAYVPCAAQESGAPIAPTKPAAPAARAIQSKPEHIEFSELLVSSPRALEPSPKLRSVVGKRVEIDGYVAQMELPPLGGFFLTPSPVVADEAGGGTADLPPAAIFVIVPSAAGRPVLLPPGLVRVTGPLELGYREEPGGIVTRIRIVVDVEDSVAAPAASVANH